MLDGRFDQQFAEIFAGRSDDLPPPRPATGAGVHLPALVFVAFALALAGAAWA